MNRNNKLQTTLKTLFALSLTDKIYVVERVLGSVQEEFHQELDKALKEILYQEAYKKNETKIFNK